MSKALVTDPLDVAGVTRRCPVALARPEPVQLSTHLFLVGGERVSHSYDASAYLVTGPRPLLIDCGSTFGWPAVHANIVSLGVSLDQLQAVLATHCHFDHVSGYEHIATQCAAPLLMHPADAAAAATGDLDRTAAFLYGAEAPPVAVGGPLPESLQSGRTSVRAIHTPGHSAGSTCFVVHDGPMRILVAADTLFGGYHPRIGSDIDAWTDSLARLAEEDFDFLSVGHAHPPVLPGAKRLVAQARLQFGVYFNPWFRPFDLEFPQ